MKTMQQAIKWGIILLTVGWIFSGCVTTKRGMLGEHTYYSQERPNIRIDLNENFKYNSKKSDKLTYRFYDNESHQVAHINFYHSGAGVHEVTDYIHPHQWIFHTPPNSQEIITGTTTILGQNWHYRDSVIHPNSASCLLIRDIAIFTRWCDVLKVLFIKELPPPECKQWKNVKQLSPVQKTAYDEFVSDFNQKIKFSNYTPE